MEIQLPPLNGQPTIINDSKSIVLIGANGSGKTRMSVWIENNNQHTYVHRVSAQKSLNMPKQIQPSELNSSREKFLYGHSNENKEWLRKNGKQTYRWSQAPETHLLNDFNALMEFLITESYQKSIEYREKQKSGHKEFDNETLLEQIKQLWEDILQHRELKICAGQIKANIKGNTLSYNGSQMSDGERAIFYFIGEVLCSPEKSIIIIDEPENHLHRSILERLWNSVEILRKDCTFIYITHNLEFAYSRNNSKILWIRSYSDNNTWDYEIHDTDSIPEALILEILGNRQKVLLVEGKKDKSYDRKFYSALFKDFNVIAVDNCQSVINSTKAFNNLNTGHYLDVRGIIDRDRRSDEEINKLSSKSVFSPKVAEIENLFLLPDVIKFLLTQLKRSEDEICNILEDIQKRILSFLSDEKESQALLFCKEIINNKINEITSAKSDSINVYEENINSLSTQLNIKDVYHRCIDEISLIVESNNIQKALKIINNKGLINASGLLNHLEWKKSAYIDYIIRLVHEETGESKPLSTIFMTYIQIEKNAKTDDMPVNVEPSQN